MKFFQKRDQKNLNPKTVAILIVILGLGLLVRLYKINTPLADWHSFRQADTVSVTREYVKHGVNILVPRYHDLSNIQSGKENPEGYRMVEFPLINATNAYLFSFFDSFFHIPLHVFSRVINILFSLGSIVFIFLLVRRYGTTFSALASAFFMAVLPYNVFFSRTTLPEIPLVFFSLLSVVLLDLYLQNQKRWLLASFIVVSALALLIKPTAIFYLLPLIVLVYEKKGLKGVFQLKWIITGILAVLPLLLWRQWILNYQEGVPAYDWLLNGNGIRFKGAFFHWIFADRIGRLILGYWGVILLGLGIIRKTSTYFFHALLVSMFLYLSIFATGNVQHDYYQIILVPVISIFLAFGLETLLFSIDRQVVNPWFSKGLALTVVIFMLAFSWYEVRGFYNINNWAIVRAGEAANSLTPEDAKVIAPYMGDTAFLYQTNRTGWPIGFNVPKFMEMGADYYISVALDDETKKLMEQCQVLQETSEFVIIDLNTCSQL